MAELALDYERLASSVGAWADPVAVGGALLTALAARYEASCPDGAALHEFQQSGATYLFDLASAAGAGRSGLCALELSENGWSSTP